MGICVIKKGKAPSLKLGEKNPSSVPMLIISEQWKDYSLIAVIYGDHW